MTASTEQERKLFEALASDNGKWLKAIERDAKGNYLLLTTAVGWMWWQAARSAPAAPAPQGGGEMVHIEWSDQASDWPWFWLLDMRGEWLHLQGADYPDGSAKHDGDCFWAHKSEVQTMRSNVGKPPIRSQP